MKNKNTRLWQKAKKIIPGGNQLLSKRPYLFTNDYWPTYFIKAKGCKITDLENKDYYDFSVTTKRSRFIKDKFDNNLLPRVPINKSDNLFKFFLKIKTPYEDIKFKR